MTDATIVDSDEEYFSEEESWEDEDEDEDPYAGVVEPDEAPRRPNFVGRFQEDEESDEEGEVLDLRVDHLVAVKKKVPVLWSTRFGEGGKGEGWISGDNVDMSMGAQAEHEFAMSQMSREQLEIRSAALQAIVPAPTTSLGGLAYSVLIAAPMAEMPSHVPPPEDC